MTDEEIVVYLKAYIRGGIRDKTASLTPDEKQDLEKLVELADECCLEHIVLETLQGV